MNRHTITGAPSLPRRDVELTIPAGGKPGQILVRTAHGIEWADHIAVPAPTVGGMFLAGVPNGTTYWATTPYPPAANGDTLGLVRQAANVSADDGLAAVITSLINAGIMKAAQE